MTATSFFSVPNCSILFHGQLCFQAVDLRANSPRIEYFETPAEESDKTPLFQKNPRLPTD
jgi:hypothetical protein